MSRKTRYFQWVDGELKGTVTTLNSIYEVDGEYFYQFDDGESCNMRFIAPMTSNPEDIKNKFLVEVLSPAYAWHIETISTRKEKVYDEEHGEITVEVPPLEDVLQANGQNEVEIESKVGKIKLTPPACNVKMPLPDIFEYMEFPDKPAEQAPAKQNTAVNIQDTADKSADGTPAPAPVSDNAGQDKPAESVRTVEESKPKDVDTDPVHILVKTCRKHNTEVTMVLNIDLPKPSVYMMAADEFENGGEKFIDCIVADIDTEIIRSALKESLLSAYCAKTEEDK